MAWQTFQFSNKGDFFQLENGTFSNFSNKTTYKMGWKCTFFQFCVEMCLLCQNLPSGKRHFFQFFHPNKKTNSIATR